MRLGEVLKRYRQFRDLGVREMGKEIGLSAATMCRVERGHECDARTLLRIMNWMLSPGVVLTPKKRKVRQ